MITQLAVKQDKQEFTTKDTKITKESRANSLIQLFGPAKSGSSLSATLSRYRPRSFAITRSSPPSSPRTALLFSSCSRFSWRPLRSLRETSFLLCSFPRSEFRLQRSQWFRAPSSASTRRSLRDYASLSLLFTHHTSPLWPLLFRVLSSDFRVHSGSAF